MLPFLEHAQQVQSAQLAQVLNSQALGLQDVSRANMLLAQCPLAHIGVLGGTDLSKACNPTVKQHMHTSMHPCSIGRL